MKCNEKVAAKPETQCRIVLKPRFALISMLDQIANLLGRRPLPVDADVEIYTWQTCPYCIRAKLLLWWKGVNFTEYKIDGDGAARVRMAERASGCKTVPQIFINNQHIGGCDELYALDQQGKLDPLLTAS
jgi:glutaredoxin 3